MEYLAGQEIYVGVSELAEIFQVTDRTVQNYAGDGMPKEERGVYPLIRCVQWRIRKLQNELEILKASGDETLHAHKVEGQKIANQERLMKLKRMMGELVNYDAVRIAWVGETKIFRKALNAMVPKLVIALESVSNNDRKRDIIAREVREVLSMIGELKIDTEEFTSDDIEDNLSEE